MKALITAIFIFSLIKVSFSQTNYIDNSKTYVLNKSKSFIVDSTRYHFTIDSLQHAFNESKTDTSKIKTKIDQIEFYWVNSAGTDSVFNYCESALRLAEEHGRKGYIPLIYDFISLYFYETANFTKCLQYGIMESHLADELESPYYKARSYWLISGAYGGMYDYRSAIDNAFKSLRISEKIGYKENMSYLYYDLGDYYGKMGVLDSALYYSNKAYDQSQLKLPLNDN